MTKPLAALSLLGASHLFSQPSITRPLITPGGAIARGSHFYLFGHSE